MQPHSALPLLPKKLNKTKHMLRPCVLSASPRCWGISARTGLLYRAANCLIQEADSETIRHLTDNNVSSLLFSCWTHIWIISSPDHSPPTLCNRTFPQLSSSPPKNKEPDPCVPFNSLTVACHHWLSLSSFLCWHWRDMKVFPLISFSSACPPPSVAALLATPHPFLIGPHYRLLSVSPRQVGRSRRSLNCLKTLVFLVTCGVWQNPTLWWVGPRLPTQNCHFSVDLYVLPDETED